MNDQYFEAFDKLVDKAFSDAFQKEPTKDVTITQPIYESIEDYTAKTGKRFRMTKGQKELGYTREEAFNITYRGEN